MGPDRKYEPMYYHEQDPKFSINILALHINHKHHDINAYITQLSDLRKWVGICAADISWRAFLLFHCEATQFKAQTACYDLNFKSAQEKIKESFVLQSSTFFFFIEIQLNVRLLIFMVRLDRKFDIKARKQIYNYGGVNKRNRFRPRKDSLASDG